MYIFKRKRSKAKRAQKYCSLKKTRKKKNEKCKIKKSMLIGCYTFPTSRKTFKLYDI